MDEETFPLVADSGTGRDQSNTWPAFKEFILLCLRPKDDRHSTFCVTVRFIILLAGRFINMAIPRELGIMADRAVPQSGIMPWKSITALAGYYLLDGVLDSVDNYASAYLQSSAYFSISSVVFSHVMRLSTDFHTDENSAEINKSIDQAQSLGTIVNEIFFGLVPTLLDIAVALVYLAPKFGAYIALLVVSFILFYGLIGRLGIEWTKPKRTQWVDNVRKASHTSAESLRLHEMITSFNQIPYQCTRFERDLKATIENYLGYNYFFAIQSFIQDIISDQSLVIGCAIVIWHIVCHSSSVGSFVSFISYWKNITSPTKRMVNSYQTISTALVDAERILQLLRKKPSVMDEGKEELRFGKCEINFRNVSFSYDRKTILKGITFTAEANQTTAIVGLSGSGKSTILRLILRLFDPNEGEITIDGHKLSSISLSSLREAVGMVQQQPELFNVSIADNVRLGRDCSQAEIETACKMACIHDAIQSFPDGYGSMVGEGGVRLSGGQRQRIALARIIVRNPSIILLDEATSAVDNITELDIRKTLRTLTSSRTMIIVAHRMSTVAKADKILVVGDGRIIDQGTHSELLTKGGLYKELWGNSKESSEVQVNDH
jgi:ABC-type multidrug transport system fused ATPase/permease subunit